MDRNHHLDAPDNEALKDIEQVSDRSELSAIYPHAHSQWDGELVSSAERDKRQQHAQDTITFGIRKEFAIIGMLIPLPIILMAFLITGALILINQDNVQLFVIPGMLLFLILIGTGYAIYKRVFKIFYQNALHAGPFITILLAMLVASASILHSLTIDFHQNQLFKSVSLISLVTLVWSIILSFVLLRVWTTPRLNGNAKVGIIAFIGLGLIGYAAYLMLPNFL